MKIYEGIEIDKFLKAIERRYYRTEYIIRIMHKRKHETEWEISNEYLTLDDNEFVWENDWDEGYDKCYVLGAVEIDDVFIVERNTYFDGLEDIVTDLEFTRIYIE